MPRPNAQDAESFEPRYPTRSRLGIPDDAYVVGVVAANSDPHPSRKNWYAIFEGFRFFLHSLENGTIGHGVHAGKRPYLYLHTDMRWHQLNKRPCIDLYALAVENGIQDRVVFAPQKRLYEGFETQYMPAVYACMDVLLHVGNEGYGLPGVEAAACGVPVIGGGWTATRETTLSGLVIEPGVWESLEAGGQKHVIQARKYPAPGFPRCDRYEPASSSIAQALSNLQNATPEQHDFMVGLGIEKASALDWDRLIDQYWIPVFDEWSARMAKEKSVVIPARGSKRQPVRPGVGSNGVDFREEITRAMETEARNVIYCPSWGEDCGIGEYTVTQSFNFGMAGYPNYIATRSEEVDAIVRASGHVRRVILHHEYSLFDVGNTRLSRGENTPGMLRTLKHLQDDMRAAGRDFEVSIVVHTVMPQQMAVNEQLKASGLKLYATSTGGAKFLGCDTLPLGVWDIPGYNPLNRPLSVRQLVQNPCPAKELDWPFTVGNFGFYQPAQRDTGAQVEICKRTGSRFLGSFASHAPDSVVGSVLCDLKAAGVESAGVWGDYAPATELMRRLEGADILYMPRNTASSDPTHGWWFSSATVQKACLLGVPIIGNSDRGYEHLQDVIITANTVEEAAAAVERLRNPAVYAEAVSKILRYREANHVTQIYAKKGAIV